MSQTTTAPSTSIIAAFDIGSNSIKMSVGRKSETGEIEEIHRQTETVRLSAGIDQSGKLAPDRIDAALNALRQMAATARDHGASRLIAVATEAVRIASNGPAFVAAVEEQTGVSILTIDGQKEAELTYLGLDASIDQQGRLVLADIGGGSSEVLVVDDGGLTYAESLPLGSGRLTDTFIPSDPPARSELAAAKEAARAKLAVLPLAAPIDRLVVLGGTGEYLRPLLSTGYPAEAHEILDLLHRLTTIPSDRLALLIEAAQARARVLPAGVAIVTALIELLQPREIFGAASGIRAGLLKAAFAGEWS